MDIINNFCLTFSNDLKIKELSELVDDLKQQKEEREYKILQYEDIIKCQKLDIDTKANLIKKFEFVRINKI